MHVVHLVDTYLNYSRTWIHHQIEAVPGVRASVVAIDVVDEGPARFPVADLQVLGRFGGPVTRWVFGRPVLARGAIRRLARAALQARDADLAHAHFGNVGWMFLPAVRAAGLPLVTSFYGIDLGRLPVTAPAWRWRYGELFADGLRFFCEGPAMAADLAALGCPREKIRVQPLGVDTTRFEVRIRARAAGDPLRVLMVARFTEKKGVPDAIAAVAAASRVADVRLTVVGDAPPRRWGRDPEQREKRRILTTVRELGLADRVTLAGRLAYDELARLAATHHVAIQPSKRSALGDTEGGAPVSLIELAATGLPAVATRHADIPHVVDEGVTGLLADEGDIETLAGHLVRLARDLDLAARLGANAASHVRRRFDLEVCRASLARHYREAIEASRRDAEDTRVRSTRS